MHPSCGKEIKVFTCNANIPLAKKIVEKLGIPLGDSEVTAFSDGETEIKINETVRGADVFIIQSTSSPANENLMQLLIMIDAMKRASAERITAVIPYYGYARQDRKSRSRDPISAKLVADLITRAGANRVLTMDLHCSQIQGFFDIPVDHLIGTPKFVNYYREKFKDNLDNVVIVSPDLGSVARTRILANKLNLPLAIIDKRRPQANKSEVMNIIGNVFGKSVILIDDMIDTAGSIVGAATALREAGALDVFAACTHGVLSGPAVERIKNSDIKELVMLDTIDIPQDNIIDKFKILTVSDLFATAIKHIHDGESVSKLFE